MISDRLMRGLRLLLSPLDGWVIIRDALKLKSRPYSHDLHLAATTAWLARAHDAGLGGISAGYGLGQGWLPPYPETSGYIIPTFLNYAKLTGNSEFYDRAIELGDWEISIQLSSGAVRGGVGINNYPMVFNTGQVMLGWIALYQKTQAPRFLGAAKRAADWLVSIQDNDGKWSQFTYSDIAHTYHARVAWPLFELSKLTGETKYFESAQKNILWVLSQVENNGWIKKMSFAPAENPLTHTIAYTLRGLLESSIYLEPNLRDRAQGVVHRAADQFVEIHNRLGRIPATIDNQWRARSSYICLTGSVQLAIIWLKLYQLNSDLKFLNAATATIHKVLSTQMINYPRLWIRGAVAGSYPIYERYMKMTYPNWAAKFLADALMFHHQITAKQ